MENVIFLSAETPPDPVDSSARCSDVPIEGHTLTFPRIVWYDAADVDSAVRQIAVNNVAPVVLAGFSKSGLGAIRVALRIPELVRGLLIFDAPLNIPPLEKCLRPAFTEAQMLVRAMHETLHPSTRIVLIGGKEFHKEMRLFSGFLTREAVAHNFIDKPAREHRWESGWVKESLKDILNEEKWGDDIPTI